LDVVLLVIINFTFQMENEFNNKTFRTRMFPDGS